MPTTAAQGDLFRDIVTSLSDSENRIAELEAELAETRAQIQRAELTRQESQRMLQLVLDTIPIRVFWKDKDLTYLGCNRLFAQDAGLATPEDIIGKNDYVLGWAEQAELYRADDRQVIDTGQSKIGYEEPQTTPDGSQIWLRTNKILLHDSSSNVIGVLGTYEDITRQKQVEQRLQQANLVLENSPVVLFRWRAAENWPVVFVSNNVTSILGYSPEELLSGATPFAKMVYPDDLERVVQEVQVYSAAGVDRFQQEYRMITKAGDVRWIDDRTMIERNAEGQITHYQGLVIDITERKQVVEAMRDSEARYAAVIAQVQDGVLIVQDSQCQFVNQALAEMLGYGLDEMENTHVIRYIAPESRELVAHRIKARLAGEDVPSVYEARLLHKDGTTIEAEFSAGIIQYRGKPANVGLIRNITGRKRAEEERQRLQQELIEAQQRAIRELSAPIIPVMDRIIVMPLVGSIDSLRARDITRGLLAGIRENRAKVVILDITGVPLVDSGVANHLNKTIQAARLKGARTIVTGVSDAVAETIVDLGIDWSGVETLADLQTGLVVALNSLGLKLTH